jgi:murein DD-endopeptidase MepM/ murein hydrolase activator NlpD
VLYAPTGASFATLKSNRLAKLPLTSGTVTSNFGYREDPIKGGESFHLGLDIAANSGSPIAAMYFGVVIETGVSASYGNYVKLYHGGGMQVLYAHCSEILVEKDAVIKAGEIVAKVGSTGDSTGNHVHIEVHVNDIAYDPADIVQIEKYV